MFLKQVKNTRTGRSNISVIFLGATKFTAKHLILELIFDGTQESDHLYVLGCIVEKDSLGPMNFRDIAGLTQERNGSNAQNATSDSCEAIIYPNTSKLITKHEASTIIWSRICL